MKAKEELSMKSMKEAALRNMTAIYIEKDGRMLMSAFVLPLRAFPALKRP